MHELDDLRVSVKSYINLLAGIEAEVDKGQLAVIRCQIPDWKGKAKHRYESARDEASRIIHSVGRDLNDVQACAAAVEQAIERAQAQRAAALKPTGVG